MNNLTRQWMHIAKLRNLAFSSLQDFQGFGFCEQFVQNLNRLFQNADTIESFDMLANDGCVKAYILIFRSVNHSDGKKAPIPTIELDYDLQSIKAKNWIENRLDSILAFGSYDCRLLSSYRELLPVFLKRNHAIRCLSLGGNTRHSLNQLGNFEDRNQYFKKCEIKPLNDLNDINAVIKLQKNIFTERSDLCSYFSQPEDLQSIAQKLQRSLPYKTYFKLTIDKKIEGFFGYHVVGQPHLFGAEASLALCLSAPLQGKGIAKIIYKYLFDRLLSKNLNQFQGQTANPAVLNMARTFKRPLRYIHVAQNSKCPETSRFDVNSFLI